jgi:transcriptional regulator with XRE-family HTH domain
MCQGPEEGPWHMDTWSNTTYHWRVRHRLTQERAAGIVGVSLTTWSRWERGQTEPQLDMARAAHEAMAYYDRQFQAQFERGRP